MDDVIIIGGGLGGLSLAILLRQAGRSVTVIEAGEYPRHKVCGEYISNESRPFLQRLGLDIDKLKLPEITQLQLTDVRGREMRAPLGLGGFGISRYMLDAALAKLAGILGATIHTQTKAEDVAQEIDGSFRVRWGGEWHSAKVVCGAWGKRSVLDTKWKRPFVQESSRKLAGFIGIKHHFRVAHESHVIALHNFPGGYCGVSPVEDGQVCVCYLSTAAALKKYSGDIAAMEGTLLSKNPFLARIFQNGEALYETPLAISQISFEKKEAVLNGVLLLGDAAGLITPLCGNGMSMAFAAAQLCAQSVEAFLSGKSTRVQMEAAYAGAWQQRFGRRLRVGRTLQAAFGKGGATTAGLFALRMLQFLQKPLIRATHGKVF